MNKYNVPLDKTKSVFFLYIFENIISRFFHPILKKLKINYDPMVFVDWLADTIFSHFYLSKCDFLLVGFGASTKKIIQKAKNKKIKTIYFLNTTHTNSKYHQKTKHLQICKSLKYHRFFNDFSDLGSPKVTSQNLLFRHDFLENYVLAQTENLQFTHVLQ